MHESQRTLVISSSKQAWVGSVAGEIVKFTSTTTEAEISAPVFNPPCVRCHFTVLREDEGYSIIVLNLPGAVGWGASEAAAEANAKQGVIDLLANYRDHKMAVPWRDREEYTIPEEARQKWVVLSVPE